MTTTLYNWLLNITPPIVKKLIANQKSDMFQWGLNNDMTKPVGCEKAIPGTFGDHFEHAKVGIEVEKSVV